MESATGIELGKLAVERALDFKQSNIVEILDSERLMVLTAPERYGTYYTHALDASILPSKFIKSLDGNRFVFGRFHLQVKKHRTLALFSTVRLHQVQSTMNLRQVLEAGGCAAFAIANADPCHFVTKDSQGLLNSSQNLTGKIYKWLNENYPAGSKNIKALKGWLLRADKRRPKNPSDNPFYQPPYSYFLDCKPSRRPKSAAGRGEP